MANAWFAIPFANFHESGAPNDAPKSRQMTNKVTNNIDRMVAEMARQMANGERTSVNELAKRLKLPEASVRRYIWRVKNDPNYAD